MGLHLLFNTMIQLNTHNTVHPVMSNLIHAQELHTSTIHRFTLNETFTT